MRLPAGVFFRFGLYAVRFLGQVPGSGGRLSAVPHRGSVDGLTGSKAVMVPKSTVAVEKPAERSATVHFGTVTACVRDRSEYETQPLASRICLSG